ncbi:amidohydrolase family protein [Salipaludibacillus sp. HK11]|uniref:amidohydrolase family protein n=1 Tax=Salipaludibacillus sp. HK11 TaxID=3394320 RepID=UPI0039FC0E12
MNEEWGGTMYDLLVKNVRYLHGEGTFDVGCLHGEIKKIGKINDTAETMIDGSGHVIVPPFIETHIHLDTALTYQDIANESGTLYEGIQLWNDYRQSMTEEDVIDRARNVIYQMIAKGVLSIRVMIDVSSPSLLGLRALLKVKKEVASTIDIQLIAFPQNGIVSSEIGVQQLEKALELGVDGISAVPHLEDTNEKGQESLAICFAMAIEKNVFVHIFCDETDDPDSKFIETVAALAIETRLYERVSVSHVNAMNYYNDAYVQKLLNLLVASKVNVVTCPLINTVMQGRLDSYPKGRGITRVKELNACGVNVACAHDDFMSPFYPFGTGSMLTAVNMLLHLAHMTGQQDFKDGLNMITYNAAKVLGLSNYGINVCHPASFLLIKGTDEHDIIRRVPTPRYVIRGGEIVSETIPEKTIMFSQTTSEL